MNLLDFIIVYLACGTPFAVYRIVLSEESAFETAVAERGERVGRFARLRDRDQERPGGPPMADRRRKSGDQKASLRLSNTRQASPREP